MESRFLKPCVLPGLTLTSNCKGKIREARLRDLPLESNNLSVRGEKHMARTPWLSILVCILSIISDWYAITVHKFKRMRINLANLLWILFLFVCMEFSVPLENFSLIWRHHHCRWRAANFELCSALMAIEQWGFFNVPRAVATGDRTPISRMRGKRSFSAPPRRSDSCIWPKH